MNGKAKDRAMLLVEDDPDDADLILRALGRARFPHETVVLRDGAEALDYLLPAGRKGGRRGGANSAMAILDLKLPKIDGLELLRRLRADERTRLLPVVVLTSSEDQHDIIESYRLGANSCVRKPTASAEFADAIRQLASYWLLLNIPVPRGG